MRRRIVTLLLLTLSFSLSAGDHQGNTLFTQLHSTGIHGTTLPAPFFADGLSLEQQKAILQNLPGRTQEVDELLRLSPVAPFVVKFSDMTGRDTRQPLRAIDLVYITPGSLDKLAQSDVLDRLLNSGRQDARIQPLTQNPKSDDTGEGQAHVTLPLMDRVQLEGTIHTMWTRTAQSLLLAGRIDPRFTSDGKYPNRWRLLKRDAEGKLQPQETGTPYEGAAFYCKFTPVAGKTDALIVEWHLVFAEPGEWFDGANLLRSKLPIVLQTKIRAFRRDLMR
jgi:hypothetical protein